MLDLKHIVMQDIAHQQGRKGRLVKMKTLLDQKAAAYLRLLATKNNINRASDYHYLGLAVTQSTEPVNGIDYIHPVVKPAVDYSTAVIAKGMAPNGEINFEFVADNEHDEVAARQATEMVAKVINQHNDPHSILQQWIQDALLHKNGEMMISPVREQVTRYVTTEGTADQLKAFEAQARDAGLTATRTQKRKKSIDMQNVMKEMQGFLQGIPAEQQQAKIDAHIESAKLGAQGDFEEAESVQIPDVLSQSIDPELSDAVTRNTIHEATYKLVGYNLNIRFRPIAQHYWMCDPTVVNVQDQPFCGFYQPMTIAEATERYPDIKMEEFEKYAQYSNVGAYQAGSLLNNLALHARDSVPMNGLPASGYNSQDPAARQVSIITCWNRYDIDDDGELELIELIFSGSYIISAKEVEFIPVANMVPRPLSQNFYGMSLAESLVPMQEYMTAGHRSEIQLGLLTATPRLGVKPDKVDFEQLQDGEAAIFILDSKFNPQTDVYPVPPPSGNPQFIDVAMQRMQTDIMAMIGMTTPQDVFNPEVMQPGNSGAKLQLALSPNQIIQDNVVKNCAEGLKDAIWLVWRTLVQYGDDYGVKKLAALYHPEHKTDFLDAISFDDMNFCERALIHIECALGMKSEENALQRQQVIIQVQTQLASTIAAMAQAGTLNPQVYKKVKKPYADTLYVLGIKDCDTYLPSDEEVATMVKGAAEAAKNKQPTPTDQKDLSVAKLNTVKADTLQAEVAGNTADAQMEGYSLIKEHHPSHYPQPYPVR